MNQNPSLRRLFRDLSSHLGTVSPWLLLNPGAEPYLGLWSVELGLQKSIGSKHAVVKILGGIPPGGHGATNRAGWVKDLVEALFGAESHLRQSLAVPLFIGNKVAGIVGWSMTGKTAPAGVARSSTVKEVFRVWQALDYAKADGSALRWVLRRSDRPTAAVRPNGQILGVSPAGEDLLKAMQFGRRHYFHSDGPSLPLRLFEALQHAGTGQLKLTDDCTARFEILPGVEAWEPRVGIEFIQETRPEGRGALTSLTPVERDVYERMLTGKTNAEISKERGTSVATIKNQVSVVLQKMQAGRRTQLIATQPCRFSGGESRLAYGGTSATK